MPAQSSFGVRYPVDAHGGQILVICTRFPRGTRSDGKVPPILNMAL